MRKKIVAGNWKMNLNLQEAIRLFDEIQESAGNSGTELIVFPPAIYLSELRDLAVTVKFGAQNFFPADSGAYTGEISVSQIKSIGVTHVLVGHSERRAIFKEGSDFLKEKVDAALQHKLTVVFCCGEPLEIREQKEELSFVKWQLEEALAHLPESEIKNIIVAYEPVWAIGTGKTASSEQAEEMHAAIRSWFADKYSQNTADEISILYGGSCNPSNAAELFSCPNVDGGLIGGASLKSDQFLQIANSF